MDWSQIGSAPIFERGNYFNPGRYKLRLLRCLSKQTQKSGVAFIAEFEVLESDNPAHPIGSKGTFFVKMQNAQQGFSNILEMMVAILGFDISNPEHLRQIETQLKPQLAQLMTALETQGTTVLQGRETVSVECRIILTKANKEFTLHVWAPWTPPPGWQPAPTPAVAQMPQRTAAQPAAAPQGYPPAYAPPAFAPPALAPQPQQAPAYPQQPQQPAFAPYGQPGMPPAGPPQQQAPQAPYGQPGMPPPGVPSWMGPK
jgi:hypothetical protein